jgi:hypothetical protein
VRSYSVVPPTVRVEYVLLTHEVIVLIDVLPFPPPPPMPPAMKQCTLPARTSAWNSASVGYGSLAVEAAEAHHG